PVPEPGTIALLGSA
ncbi:PEP-CTERM sorting domain-containing protein, partial [Marinobacter sp. AC-23]